MARRSSSSSNSVLGGCGSIVAGIFIAVMYVLEWMQKNPILTAIIVIGVIALILLIIYLIKQPKQNYSKQQYNVNTVNNILNESSSTNKYKQNNDTSLNQKITTTTVQNTKPQNSSLESNFKYEENQNSKNSIIDIEICTKEEIQTLDGFNVEKAEIFIQERTNGKMWYDMDSFVQDFELQPHEMVMIQDRIKFPEKPKNKYGRKIDI